MTVSKASENVLLLLLFSPIISYFTFGQLGLKSSTYYFQLISCILGLFVLLQKFHQIKLNSILLFGTCYLIYVFVWSFFTGKLEEKGIFNTTNASNLSIILVIIVVYNTTFSNSFIKRSLLIMKITVVLACIVSLIQIFNYNFLDANSIWLNGDSSDSLVGDLYNDRRVSIFGYVDPNELGLSFIPLLSVLVGFLLFTKNKYYFVFLILGGITAILSNTRYIMVGYLIIAIQIIMSFRFNTVNLIKYISISSLIFVLLYFVLTNLGYDIKQWYEDRLLSEGSLKETTRYSAWLNFLRFFPENPFLGIGVHMTREIQIASNEAGSSQIHVGYLAHLVSFGIIGSLLLFGFWFQLIKTLFITAKKTKYYGSFFSVVVFLWANATLVKYSMFYYGIIYALIFDKIMRDFYLNQRLKNLNQNDLIANK